jgi:preprotein translocase subunit SecE
LLPLRRERKQRIPSAAEGGRAQEGPFFGAKLPMEKKVRWYKRFWIFLKDVRAEVKKVSWPARNEVYSTTLVVIIAMAFFGVYLYFMDVLFSWVLLKIKAFFG